ncbi:unnamed protein product [Dimorphilus gyrociliatus]|uniref:K Homology domain-containing protein n=1 Tax=Dimorphilus gyrociliatus TaxID=2664684 RepID=A0A7I8VN72_9ANNE|nr:unnamed protein product [Dimorphilus gyrociliatus]
MTDLEHYRILFSKCLAMRNFSTEDVMEKVQVPNSEYVSQIVGTKGCKIMKIISETNTKITTPKRHEESVFCVQGSPENVQCAVSEIEKEVDRIQSQQTIHKRSNKPMIEYRHPVRYRHIGLTIGKGGSTIQTIKRIANVEVDSPSILGTPEFKIVGDYESVLKAISYIEQNIAQKTASGLSSPFNIDLIREALTSVKPY